MGFLLIAELAGAFTLGTAPAAPTVSVRCLQISPSKTPGRCTYKAPPDPEVLTAFALQSYTLDWFEGGEPHHVGCTAGPCAEPDFTFTADVGTTIHVTVTQGVVIVRQGVPG